MEKDQDSRRVWVKSKREAEEAEEDEIADNPAKEDEIADNPAEEAEENEVADNPAEEAEEATKDILDDSRDVDQRINWL